MNKEILAEILPRHAAGSFELKEGTGGITGMCPCGQFLEIYKIDKTFRIQSPESIDPEQTNPNALWVTTPVSDIGSKNPIISRLLLQGHEILKAALFDREIDKEVVLLLLHTCKENLLACDKVAKKVAVEVDKIILKIQTEGVATEKNARGLNPFPHISDLTTECDTFLTKAKRAIKSICELPKVFFALPTEDNNFDSLATSLAPILEHDDPLLKFVTSQTTSIKQIIELRNCQEHPKKHRKTVIENFRLTPDTKIMVPQWYITGDKATPIKEEMGEIVSYLLEIAETMLILLVMASVKKELPFVIEKIEDSNINPDAPIKYRLSMSLKLP